MKPTTSASGWEKARRDLPSNGQLLRLNSVRMALLLVGIVATEGGIHLALTRIFPINFGGPVAAGIDASVLVAILAPTLWWIVVHPLRRSAVSERHRAVRLVAVLEATPDLVGTADPEGRLVYLNRAGRRMLGLGEQADLTRHNIRELHDAASGHVVLTEGIPTALREGVWSGETELRALDGRAIPVSQVIQAHHNPDGTLAFVSTIARDLTASKRVDESMRQSHDLLQLTGRLAKIGAWEVDLDTRTVHWTDEVARIREVDPAYQATLAEAIQFYAPEARPVVEAAVQAAIDAGTSFDLDLPMVTGRGRHVWVRTQGTAQRLDGKTIRLYGALQDITERKQAEEALRESQQFLAQSQKIAHLGNWMVNLETGAATWSDELYHLYGVSPREFAPSESAFLALIHPDDQPAMRAWGNAAVSGAKPGPIEFRVVRPDGTLRVVEGDGEVFVNAENKPITLAGTAQDITERARAQQKLQDSERLLQESQSIAGLGSYVLDVPAARWSSSPVLDGIFGIDDRYERSVDGWLSLVHPECQDQMRRYLSDEVLGKHGRFDMEYRIIRHSDGHERWVRGLGELEFDAQDRPIRMIGTICDITARVQAETALRLQAAALYASADAVVITDRSGVIDWVNPAFTRLTGYTAEESLGRNPRDLLKSGKHTQAFYKDLWDTILAGQAWHGEMINRRKNGSLYTEEQSVTPILDTSGAITHFVAIKEDVTERLKLEAELRQAQKMESVGQLASGIAHDFNNLLTVINGTADLLLTQMRQDDQAHADVQDILQAGQRAAALTHQLLAFSRQQILEPRVMNFNTVVAGMESLLRRLLGEDIELVIVQTPGVGHVKADPGQIEQVITNLAVNARDAMPQGGRLTIETQNVTIGEDDARTSGVAVPPGSYALLAVSDTGVGMDEATCARIFEPFFTTKGEGKGTGLGLSTVFGIVKQSHGFIEVHSEIGRGTSFKSYLPLVIDGVDIARPAPTGAATRGTETILLVEDNEEFRKLATRILGQAGYTVVGAATGEEALRLQERQEAPVHLLLSDVVLPGIGGRELADGLAPMRPEMRVLYMSGYTSDTVIRHGVLAGEVPFLNKPTTAAALLLKVREVLDS